MRKLLAALAAFTLCAALLGGCKNDAASGGTSSTPGGSSAASVPGAAPDATPGAASSGAASSGAASSGAASSGAAGTGTAAGLFDGENAITAYSAENLATVLHGMVTYGPGTAGSSLNTARAAGDLLRFGALAGTQSATLGADTQAWLDGLSEDDRATARENWQAVREQARSIAADPAEQAGILGDAGYGFDFSALDMSGSEAFLNTLDSVLGA